MADFATSSGAHPLLEIARIMAQHPRFVVTADPPLGEDLSTSMQAEMSRDLRAYRRVKQYVDPMDPYRTITLFMAGPSDEHHAVQNCCSAQQDLENHHGPG